MLTQSLFDISLEDNDAFNSEDFLEAQDNAMREAVNLFFNPWHRHMTWLPGVKKGLKAEQKLREIGRLVIERYRAEHAAENGQSKDDKTIMSHIMSYDYPTEEHRISDVIVFMIAGHETTAHTLSFLLLCLANCPRARRKLQKELDGIAATGPNIDVDGKGCESDRKILTISDLSSAEYFNYCLKESQR